MTGPFTTNLYGCGEREGNQIMKLPKTGTWLRMLASAQPNRAARRAGAPPSGWGALARSVSRFGLVYSGLYCATNPQIVSSLLGGGLGNQRAAAETWSKLCAMPTVRKWVAGRVFNTTVDDRFEGGDNRYAWVGQFCSLAAAAGITPVWAALDRRQTSYHTVRPWIQTAVRFSLAAQMFYYGAAKAVPLQFQTPLSRLVEPLGNFSPMDLLWAQTGHSKPYQILLGCAEIAGGLLLLSPRTATAGALLSSAELAQVLLLNLTFDVPVKLHTSHLLLLSLALLAPEAGRLTTFFLSDKEIHLPARPQLFGSTRANQIATAVQVVAGLGLLAVQLRSDWQLWKKMGGGQAKPPLYGIWQVDEFTVGGEHRPPLTDDEQRWRRVVFDLNNVMSVQRMDDSLESYITMPDRTRGSITLLKMTDPTWNATLTVQRQAGNQLTLEGNIDGDKLQLQLHRLDHEKFTLNDRGFHWVQENSSLR
uniref:DoxX family protein n=1 Tax=uncultured bacterium esnapd9 TaxID=1366616 RepID=S5TUD3_9BACT|nr:hypothetical protein [uncultured bacterium esnapd9]